MVIKYTRLFEKIAAQCKAICKIDNNKNIDKIKNHTKSNICRFQHPPKKKKILKIL